nr:hypothetical protein [Tanacetum cinerariifolium]
MKREAGPLGRESGQQRDAFSRPRQQKLISQEKKLTRHLTTPTIKVGTKSRLMEELTYAQLKQQFDSLDSRVSSLDSPPPLPSLSDQVLFHFFLF